MKEAGLWTVNVANVTAWDCPKVGRSPLGHLEAGEPVLVVSTDESENGEVRWAQALCRLGLCWVVSEARTQRPPKARFRRDERDDP